MRAVLFASAVLSTVIVGTASAAPGDDFAQAVAGPWGRVDISWAPYSGVLAKNSEGRQAMTRVTLRPVVTFAGTRPTQEQFAQLHEKTHERCFIANSVKTEIILDPRIASDYAFPGDRSVYWHRVAQVVRGWLRLRG